MITVDIAKKVLEVVDHGLVKGVGKPKPGEMCVEAAVCYAMGEPHGDQPTCVSYVLRSLKIVMNDSNWSSKEARAKGLRRIAIAQLGTSSNFDEEYFMKRVAEMTIRKMVPIALRAAAKLQKDIKHREALEETAIVCAVNGNKKAAYAARAAAYAADAATDATYAAAYVATYAAAYVADAADAADAATDATYAARAACAAARATDAAADATTDEILALFAEEVVQILIAMKTPGSQFLSLTE